MALLKKKRQKLGEMLSERGVLTALGLRDALAHAEKNHLRLGEAIIALHLADEEEVTRALADQFDLPYLELTNDTPVTESNLLPDDVVRTRWVLPLARDNGRLKVAITDPQDIETLDMLKFRLNADISPVLVSKGRLKRYLDKGTDSNLSIDAAVDELRRTSMDLAPEEASGLDLLGDDSSAPIVRLVTMLITKAVEMRASDIHIEPMADRVRVRYRVDGVCLDRPKIPKRMQGPVINRVKIMAGIDLAEKRLPTDGRIKMLIGGSQIDFRVSCLPAYHGESVVLRILRPESVRLGIPALGFDQGDYGRFMKIIRRPNGIFLVTGPTGSGKTTTLYAAINELNRPDRKIITAEDPVEYNFTGVNQVQVKEDIGLSFAKILRSMLRQAPNIILVGEIRDMEVAEVAIQAALTGHLVFSTLHTNDAPSAIPRLVDMGVKPFLVASSIQAVMAQRLIRVICKDCKDVDTNVDKRVLHLLGFTDDEIEKTTFYKGKGCNNCAGTGYRGRQGIFELMEMDNTIRELAYNRSALVELRKAALAGGMITLMEDGRRKIKAGVTTAEEVIRHAQATELLVE